MTAPPSSVSPNFTRHRSVFRILAWSDDSRIPSDSRAVVSRWILLAASLPVAERASARTSSKCFIRCISVIGEERRVCLARLSEFTSDIYLRVRFCRMVFDGVLTADEVRAFATRCRSDFFVVFSLGVVSFSDTSVAFSPVARRLATSRSRRSTAIERIFDTF